MRQPSPALSRVATQWEKLGSSDPLWAILTLPGKEGGNWSLDEFMSTGVAEIENLFRETADLGINIPRRRALDFGCGVGRLTQALCAHFDRCDGVDVAPSMIELARKINACEDRCVYHLNTAPDLRIFPDGTFSFVCSFLVLQHMHPDVACRYVRELVRVLRTDGVLVFQIPSSVPSVDSLAEAVRGAARALPQSALRAVLSVSSCPSRAHAGEKIVAKLTVLNAGASGWPSSAPAGGRFGIRAANRWLTGEGMVWRQDDGRCPLPRALEPGESLELDLPVTAPSTPGSYVLEIDMVQEGVCWFQAVGSNPLRVPFEVTLGPQQADKIAKAQDSPALSIPVMRKPFRYRYPGAFALMDKLGLWAIYRSVRRLSNPDIRPAPPSVMDMFGIPRSTIERVVAECGGRVRFARTETWNSGVQSTHYWVTR